MFDISWSHLLIFALAAIVLVPSKDLPALLRTIGKYVGDARKMAREFRSQVDDALRETELADIKKSVETEMRGIESSASLAETERSLNAALNSNPTFPKTAAEPASQMIPSVTESLPVTETAAKVPEMTTSAPASVPTNGAARPVSDGIEVVRAGRGSLAQRTKPDWKKTAAPGSGA
jgi:sec-independent protein translocase protein TatB